MSGGRNDARRQTGPALRTAVCPHPEKACYASKARAKTSLKRMTGVVGHETLRPYRCECGTWHLGHKPGSRKQRPRDGYPDSRRDAA